MSRAGTLAWLARHEARLTWRDWISMMTAGRRRRVRTVVLGFGLFILFTHGFAYLILAPYNLRAGAPDKQMLVTLTGLLAVSWSLMLSQALESVTRAFYARADFDLILSSPVAARRLFAVRIGAMTLTTMVTTLTLAAPFVNVLAWRGGVHWFGAYGVAAALAMIAVSVAIVLTIVLFRSMGPRRTRLIAQIIAAVIGAAFLIGIQVAAILSYRTISRMAFLQSEWVVNLAPDPGSILWWPARATLGNPMALISLLGLSIIVLGATILRFAPRFDRYVLTASGLSQASKRQSHQSARFRNASPAQALRRKELTLLWRDPWLVSQTLMQLLYLVPPAFLLWRNFDGSNRVSVLVVPVLIMAAGQLGGALAWLAISGEDAPDLIASAPVSPSRALRAKTEVVMSGTAIVFGPFIAVFAVAAPFDAFAACLGVAIAAASSTSIQIWFRTQAKRSHFRRRLTSSRIATYAEALSSSSWATAGAMAAAGTWLAIAPGLIALAILGGTRMISPARN